MDSKVAGRLANNVVQLRDTRRVSHQEQMAKLAVVPRATCAHRESGHANPTLAVTIRRLLPDPIPGTEIDARLS